MKYEWLDEYLISLPGAEKDYKPEWAWFRYQVRGKLFAAVCSPARSTKPNGGHDLVNLKCDPAEAEFLRVQYPEIYPASTATSASGSRASWIGICPTGSCGTCAPSPTG